MDLHVVPVGLLAVPRRHRKLEDELPVPVLAVIANQPGGDRQPGRAGRARLLVHDQFSTLQLHVLHTLQVRKQPGPPSAGSGAALRCCSADVLGPGWLGFAGQVEDFVHPDVKTPRAPHVGLDAGAGHQLVLGERCRDPGAHVVGVGPRGGVRVRTGDADHRFALAVEDETLGDFDGECPCPGIHLERQDGPRAVGGGVHVEIVVGNLLAPHLPGDGDLTRTRLDPRAESQHHVLAERYVRGARGGRHRHERRRCCPRAPRQVHTDVEVQVDGGRGVARSLVVGLDLEPNRLHGGITGVPVQIQNQPGRDPQLVEVQGHQVHPLLQEQLRLRPHDRHVREERHILGGLRDHRRRRGGGLDGLVEGEADEGLAADAGGPVRGEDRGGRAGRAGEVRAENGFGCIVGDGESTVVRAALSLLGEPGIPGHVLHEVRFELDRVRLARQQRLRGLKDHCVPVHRGCRRHRGEERDGGAEDPPGAGAELDGLVEVDHHRVQGVAGGNYQRVARGRRVQRRRPGRRQLLAQPPALPAPNRVDGVVPSDGDAKIRIR
mmetsp:Transcript_35703/g.93391  ORF Transcript_35703/g.93391 Transcript_35703/m.93391 type:complete len:549 (+) Transcript_35703:321-1967(+)